MRACGVDEDALSDREGWMEEIYGDLPPPLPPISDKGKNKEDVLVGINDDFSNIMCTLYFYSFSTFMFQTTILIDNLFS